MVEPELVRQIRGLAAQGWGAKRIARELEVSRNTVRRYLRGGEDAAIQRRPGARKPDQAMVARAVELFDTTAEGNPVVGWPLMFYAKSEHPKARVIRGEVPPGGSLQNE